MSVTSIMISANKKTSAVTVVQSEFIMLQDMTIEEKRLNLALGLRKFDIFVSKSQNRLKIKSKFTY